VGKICERIFGYGEFLTTGDTGGAQGTTTGEYFRFGIKFDSRLAKKFPVFPLCSSVSPVVKNFAAIFGSLR
jgi:hypothetical protein